MRQEQKDMLEQIRKNAATIEENAIEAGYNASVAKEYALLTDDTKKEGARNALIHGIQMTAGLAKEMAGDIESIAIEIERTAENLLQDPIEEGHTPTEEELRDMYRDKRTNVKEDKSAIAYLLGIALKATRAGADVDKIMISDEGNLAIVMFGTGGSKAVCIEADSGIAMIIDICRALM